MTNEERLQTALELKGIIQRIGSVKFEKESSCILKHAEKHLIFMLSAMYNREPVKPSDIAKKMGVTLPAVSHHINALEKEGYIERLPDSKDKRVLLITLSEKGRNLDDQMKEKFFQNICGLVDHLGEEDSNELIRLMKKVVKYF